MANPVKAILDKFGGIRPAARALERPHSTVSSWAQVGLIPAHEQQHVLDTARGLGLPVGPADFFTPRDPTDPVHDAESAAPAPACQGD